jgi:hypothetical protein
MKGTAPAPPQTFDERHSNDFRNETDTLPYELANTVKEFNLINSRVCYCARLFAMEFNQDNLAPAQIFDHRIGEIFNRRAI